MSHYTDNVNNLEIFSLYWMWQYKIAFFIIVSYDMIIDREQNTIINVIMAKIHTLINTLWYFIFWVFGIRYRR